jgi:hypothetical protein
VQNIGGGGHIACRAEASLVRELSAQHPLRDRCTHSTREGHIKAKCAAKDLRKHCGHICQMRADHEKGGGDIDPGHDRNHDIASRRDATNAAKMITPVMTLSMMPVLIRDNRADSSAAPAIVFP